MPACPRPSLEAGHVAEKAYLGPTYALLYLRLAMSQIPNDVPLSLREFVVMRQALPTVYNYVCTLPTSP